MHKVQNEVRLFVESAEAHPVGASHTAQIRVAGLQRLSVMVVDHNPWTRLSLTAGFRQDGVDVVEASNGVSALRKALMDAPHVVVLGSELPELSAPDVMLGLRSDPRMRHTAIVALTNGEAAADADAALALPWTPVDLLATLVEALELRPQTQAAIPMRSVIASPFGAASAEAVVSGSTSRTRKAGRSGKWRLSSGIETL
jgi:CheY-like chemotaxis protein